MTGSNPILFAIALVATLGSCKSTNHNASLKDNDDLSGATPRRLSTSLLGCTNVRMISEADSTNRLRNVNEICFNQGDARNPYHLVFRPVNSSSLTLGIQTVEQYDDSVRLIDITGNWVTINYRTDRKSFTVAYDNTFSLFQQVSGDGGNQGGGGSQGGRSFSADCNYHERSYYSVNYDAQRKVGTGLFYRRSQFMGNTNETPMMCTLGPSDWNRGGQPPVLCFQKGFGSFMAFDKCSTGICVMGYYMPSGVSDDLADEIFDKIAANQQIDRERLSILIGSEPWVREPKTCETD